MRVTQATVESARVILDRVTSTIERIKNLEIEIAALEQDNVVISGSIKETGSHTNFNPNVTKTIERVPASHLNIPLTNLVENNTAIFEGQERKVEKLTLSPIISQDSKTAVILRAAETLLSHLITRNQITTSKLSKAIQAYTNDFQWKDAYEALEIAQIQWLLQYQGEPTITELSHLLDLCPTHTVRSSESVERQQFSTPLPLASVVAQAAQITSSDLVLDPSAGLGILLAFAQRKGCTVVANELAPQRHALLKSIFPAAVVTGVNAEHLEDYLPSTARYSVILMNPPFTSGVHRKQRTQSVTLAHLKSALALLAPGGRLAIVTANTSLGSIATGDRLGSISRCASE